MGFVDAFERETLDARFGSANPATWYVGLSSTISSDDGTGFTEPTGIGAYARVAKTNDATHFPAATTTGGRTVKKNGTKITWTNPTASWGQQVELGFFKTLTGGAPSFTQRLDDPITVSSGNTPVEIDIGELEIEAD